MHTPSTRRSVDARRCRAARYGVPSTRCTVAPRKSTASMSGCQLVSAWSATSCVAASRWAGSLHSTRIDGPAPDTLKGLTDAGVKYIELNPAPKGKESLESDIYNAAEIDLWGNVYRQKLVDIARGAADGTKDSYFADLNKKWAAAKASVEG